MIRAKKLSPSQTESGRRFRVALEEKKKLLRKPEFKDVDFSKYPELHKHIQQQVKLILLLLIQIQTKQR